MRREDDVTLLERNWKEGKKIWLIDKKQAKRSCRSGRHKNKFVKSYESRSSSLFTFHIPLAHKCCSICWTIFEPSAALPPPSFSYIFTSHFKIDENSFLLSLQQLPARGSSNCDCASCFVLFQLEAGRRGMENDKVSRTYRQQQTASKRGFKIYERTFFIDHFYFNFVDLMTTASTEVENSCQQIFEQFSKSAHLNSQMIGGDERWEISC